MLITEPVPVAEAAIEVAVLESADASTVIDSLFPKVVGPRYLTIRVGASSPDSSAMART